MSGFSILVGGAKKSGEKVIRDYFQTFGVVISVELEEFDWSCVSFAKSGPVDACLRRAMHFIDGRKVRVTKARSKAEKESSRPTKSKNRRMRNLRKGAAKSIPVHGKAVAAQEDAGDEVDDAGPGFLAILFLALGIPLLPAVLLMVLGLIAVVPEVLLIVLGLIPMFNF